MVVKIGARQAFALYAHKARHTRITQTRIQWRNRKKKAFKNVLTPEQIADRVKKLKDKRIEKGEALEEADNTIKSLARALWERFRDHTPQYYYRLLTQQAKKTLTKRKTNMWNAYVYQESQKRIAGTRHMDFSHMCTHLDLQKGWNRRRQILSRPNYAKSGQP